MTQDTSSTLSDLFYVFSDGVIAKEASELWNAAKTKCNSGEYSVDAFLKDLLDIQYHLKAKCIPPKIIAINNEAAYIRKLAIQQKAALDTETPPSKDDNQTADENGAHGTFSSSNKVAEISKGKRRTRTSKEDEKDDQNKIRKIAFYKNAPDGGHVFTSMPMLKNQEYDQIPQVNGLERISIVPYTTPAKIKGFDEDGLAPPTLGEVMPKPLLKRPKIMHPYKTILNKYEPIGSHMPQWSTDRATLDQADSSMFRINAFNERFPEARIKEEMPPELDEELKSQGIDFDILVSPPDDPLIVYKGLLHRILSIEPQTAEQSGSQIATLLDLAQQLQISRCAEDNPTIISAHLQLESQIINEVLTPAMAHLLSELPSDALKIPTEALDKQMQDITSLHHDTFYKGSLPPAKAFAFGTNDISTNTFNYGACSVSPLAKPSTQRSAPSVPGTLNLSAMTGMTNMTHMGVGRPPVNITSLSMSQIDQLKRNGHLPSYMNSPMTMTNSPRPPFMGNSPGASQISQMYRLAQEETRLHDMRQQKIADQPSMRGGEYKK